MPRVRTAHNGVSAAQARIDCAQTALNHVNSVDWCCWSVGGSAGAIMYTAKLTLREVNHAHDSLFLKILELRSHLYVALIVTYVVYIFQISPNNTR